MTEIPSRIHSLFDDGERLESFEPEMASLKQLPWSKGIAELHAYEHGGAPHLLRYYQIETEQEHQALMRLQWRNEVMAALRLAHRQHPSLPQLVDGYFYEDEGVGFVLLRENGVRLDSDGHPLRERFTEEPGFAFRRFLALLEALAYLHEEGIIHRFMVPSAVRARKLPDEYPILDGFILSSFVRTWLRDRWQGSKPTMITVDTVQEGFFLPPERHPDGREDLPEGTAADVFGLGMLGMSWLVLPHEDWPVLDDEYSTEAQQDLLELLHEEARQKLPKQLAEPLVTATQFWPNARPTNARELLESLRSSRGTVLSVLESQDEPEEPYQIRYLEETMKALNQGRFVNKPVSARGAARFYQEFIEKDLYQGELIHSPSGYYGYANSERTDEMRDAQTVLLGRDCVYFCEYLRPGYEEPPTDRALLIKYVTWGEGIEDLRKQASRRSIPSEFAVDCYVPGAVNRPLPDESPSWQSLVNSVRLTDQEELSELILASRWRLQVEEARLARQAYPYKIVEERETSYDLRCEELDEDSGAAFGELLERSERRPLMGQFFRQFKKQCLDAGDEPICAVKSRTSHDIELRLDEVLDDNTIRVRRNPNMVVPVVGRIAPESSGTKAQLSRQHQALQKVLKQGKYLHEQLNGPFSLRIPPQGEMRFSSEDLSPETKDLVDTLVTKRPLFVLQGPPGTGKTFTSSEAVYSYLKAEPFDRVLISAQSHYALDHLLESIVDRLETDPDQEFVVIRVASESTRDKLSDEAKEYLVEEVLERVGSAIPSVVPEGLTPELQAVAREWRGLIDNETTSESRLALELGERLRESASVVFCTANSALPRRLGIWRSTSFFDWAVIEEAAKGWLTEILIPAVRSVSWLLVGDHKQLPAFRADDLEKLLEIDMDQEITAAETGVIPSDEWKVWLRYFAALMEQGKNGDAVHTLTVQRRMHPDIGQLVSDVFYDGEVNSHPSTETQREHGYDEPSWLVKRNVIWLDTSTLDWQDESNHNLSNVVEQHVVRWLLPRFLTNDHQFDEDIPRRVILSPYHDQRKALERQVRDIGNPVKIHTVDSFQGRQAEEVIVSMVRSNHQRDIGFMSDPHRLNVMLSRARRLLILIGNLSHFEDSAAAHAGHAHVKRLAEYLRENDHVLDLDRLGFNAPGS